MCNLRTLLAIALAPMMAMAAEHGSWSDVTRLQTGRPVKVTQRSGNEQRGELVSVNESGVTLRVGHGEARIARTDIRKVAVPANHRLRNMAMMAGIGVVVGVIIDQTLGTRLRNEGSFENGARVLTIAAPAGIFAAIGAFMRGQHTVYETGK